MENKNSRSQSDKERLHEMRSENARNENRDQNGRFTASDKKQERSNNDPNMSSNNNMNDGEIDIILIDDGIDCGC